MVDANRVIEILKKYPKGLKAKDIAMFVGGADRKMINHILYSHPNLFVCNGNYEWTIADNNLPAKSVKPPISKNVEVSRKYLDEEILGYFSNYYVQIRRGYCSQNIVKIYCYSKDDYIIQSTDKRIECPFCDKNIPVRACDCKFCGHTMHEISEKLYSEWNINGHRIYVTEKAVDKYPEAIRQQEIYKAIRRFILACIPYPICCRFGSKTLEEVHLGTLVLIYQMSLEVDKVEDEITVEISRAKKAVFKQVVRSALRNNPEAIATVWEYYHKYLDYKFGSAKIKPLDFSIKLKISDSEEKEIDIRFFDLLHSQIKQNTQKCFEKACTQQGKIVDYKAGKQYMAYMELSRRTPSLHCIKDMVSLKLYGELNLSGDTIIQTVKLSMKDTIEGTEYLQTYHKACDHYCVKVYLKIPLLLSNGDLIIRTVLGTYCDICKKYFVLDTEFRKMLCEGKMQVQISFSESGHSFYGMDLSPESLLRKCGYTVSANSGITKEQRQKLLEAIVKNELYTPAKIVSHFRFLISINNNVTTRNMSAAITKWQDDIAFLQQHYS